MSYLCDSIPLLLSSFFRLSAVTPRSSRRSKWFLSGAKRGPTYIASIASIARWPFSFVLLTLLTRTLTGPEVSYTCAQPILPFFLSCLVFATTLCRLDHGVASSFFLSLSNPFFLSTYFSKSVPVCPAETNITHLRLYIHSRLAHPLPPLNLSLSLIHPI
ncbi:hypothetical protein GGR54DRAFT_230302 [Hypoxylon sp. NC1633]|nr:hypothetical protein GGR54DRAFT_230302 [Hypoxylon sp. NC1633]